MDKFKHIDTWVFDLDNTLYDAESHVFPVCGDLMTDYVANLLSLDLAAAKIIRTSYYKKYGTTLRGLMTEHGIEPEEFLVKTHDIDLAPIAPCPITQETLSDLKGRKFVFTNAPRAFAVRMIDHLGIGGHFDDIFAIEDADYWPKPHAPTYDVFLDKFSIDPTTSCMFEDMEVNLKPAHDLGMRTVWLHGSNALEDYTHVHDRAERLPQWLQKFKGKE